MIRSLALVAVTAVLALTGAGSAQAATKLIASVGPGFTITLKTATGKTVTKLKAGKYTIVVRDRSNIHNFFLKGRGVTKDSGIMFVGAKTWTVTLRRGKYTFVCTPHADSMKGAFTVS